MASGSTAGPSSIPYTIPLAGGIPSTHTTHTEATTTILFPKSNSAFLNPVQQYNRDLSIAVIRTWNEVRKQALREKWESKGLSEEQVRRKREKKKRKKEEKAAKQNEGVVEGSETAESASVATSADPEKVPAKAVEAETNDSIAALGEAHAGTNGATTSETPIVPFERSFRAPPITILEALSATGLRSIRYAKEIPDVKYVLANDLSPSACEAMRTNIAFNGVGESSRPMDGGGEEHAVTAIPGSAVAEEVEIGEEEAQNLGVKGADQEKRRDLATDAEMRRVGRREGCRGKVKVTEGDACALMYSRRNPQVRVDVVDLDPYGTAAPFLDSAIGCIADGGLLAVTCTDVAVLAGTQYPEKCFSNYGGVCVGSEYSHEIALRLVLSSIAQTAARYGRYITPLLSFSIDFYVRLFIRIDTSAQKVKELASNIGSVYVCSYCQAPTVQPFGRTVQRDTRDGRPVTSYRTAAGPSVMGSTCEHCAGTLHDSDFAAKAIESIKDQQADYATWPRMNGMLKTAHENLVDKLQEINEPFYFTPNKLYGLFHTTSGPSVMMISALLNAGYSVSRSHAASGSIKTTAPRSFIYDIVREYVKTHPVRLDKIAEGSPARKILAKKMIHAIDFTPHPDAKRVEKGEKIVRYQVNPTAYWGPGVKAKMIQTPAAAASTPATAAATKRKVDEGVSDLVNGDETGDHSEGNKRAKPDDTATS